MGLTFFIATAGLVVAGYLGYRKLQSLEEEIREELEMRDRPKESEDEGVKAEAVKPAAPSSAGDASEQTLEALVLDEVRRHPGILQTGIYEAFADRDRKELQGMLLKMDRAGRLRREKKGSTYQLFPL